MIQKYWVKKEKLLTWNKREIKISYSSFQRVQKRWDDFGISFCLKSSILEIMENYKNLAIIFWWMEIQIWYTKSTKISLNAKYASVSAAVLADWSRYRFMDEISPFCTNYNFHEA